MLHRVLPLRNLIDAQALGGVRSFNGGMAGQSASEPAQVSKEFLVRTDA